jgi:hypothetical protein
MTHGMGIDNAMLVGYSSLLRNRLQSMQTTGA